MLVLDTTSKTITAVLSAAPATNQPNYVVAWADNNGTTFTEGASDGTTNSTTTVTMVASPAASTRRVIKSIYIQNTDTAQVTVTVGYYNGTNTRVLAKVILNIGDTWTTDATFDPNGQLKYVFGSVNAATQLINQVPTANGGTNLSSFTANGIVYASSTTVLATGSALVFDGTNMGINVTPSAWGSAYRALNIASAGNGLAGATGGAQTFITAGAYFDGTNWKYAQNSFASYYQTSSGGHTWTTAASGTAGNNITFTTVMTLSAAGNLGIGVTPAVKLDVLGTIQAAAAATQDAVRLAGRAGGTGTFAVTLTPTTLTASRTLTLPDATTTVVGTDATQTLTNKTLSNATITGTLTAGGSVGTSVQFLQSTGTGVQWAPPVAVLAKQTDVFTSGTLATYTAPANTQWVKITVVGQGGSCLSSTSVRANGGGAGGVAYKWLAMTAGQTLIYTVGTSGAASTVSSGTLTISTITANAGSNGTTSAYAASSTTQTAGGTASGGDINITGGSSGKSYGTSTAITTQVCGKGGDCPGWGTGGVGAAITAGVGGDATGYGSGAGGCLNTLGVGSSGPAIIIFEAY
jgi:hypothetical protein